MEQSTPKPFILVLEDNPAQIILIQNIFQEDAAAPQVKSIAEGSEALNFIHRREEYTQAQRPDLILLNLHLAGGYGRVILKELKSSVALRRIPVIILTESDNEQDIFESYTLQGNSYVIKSLEQERLEQMVQRIKEFWLGIVTLPLE